VRPFFERYPGKTARHDKDFLPVKSVWPQIHMAALEMNRQSRVGTRDKASGRLSDIIARFRLSTFSLNASRLAPGSPLRPDEHPIPTRFRWPV